MLDAIRLIKLGRCMRAGCTGKPAAQRWSGGPACARLRSSVIVESVETEDDLEAVAECGVGYAQGQLFGAAASTPVR